MSFKRDTWEGSIKLLRNRFIIDRVGKGIIKFWVTLKHYIIYLNGDGVFPCLS